MTATVTTTETTHRTTDLLELAEPPEQAIEAAVEVATERVAPLWPLDSFVAVNPYMGLSEMRFAEASHLLARVAGSRLMPSRAFYEEALSSGRIDVDDIRHALSLVPPPHGAPREVGRFLRDWRRGPEVTTRPLPTVASVVSELAGHDWDRWITSHLSTWAGGYFNQGQAVWRCPWRHLAPYAAWRAEAEHDRSPEVAGLTGFRDACRALPTSVDGLLEHAVRRLGVPDESLPLYFHRLLMCNGGWAGHARYQDWQGGLRGRRDRTLRELLAVRLAWECILLERQVGARTAWREVLGRYGPAATPREADLDSWADLVMQTAFEHAFQRGLHERLAESARPPEPSRPRVQMAFCIDVRSEVFRRALEAVAPGCTTLGFAGFFGFPIEHVPLGATRGPAHCPALIEPTHPVLETAPSGAIRERLTRRQAVGEAWSEFKKGAITSFGFVETVGLGYVGRLVADSCRPLGSWREGGPLPTDEGRTFGLGLEPSIVAGRVFGIPHDARVDRAEAALRGMSLTTGFARLVVLAGHGSTSVNNPHASGLDCGACGGHSGEPNARVAATVLNDAKVREELARRGIEIPDDTHFVAALHDTTTDDVTLCDLGSVPASHRPDVERLREWLREASDRARTERAPLLEPPRLGRGNHGEPHAELRRRAHDWSQVRPEWGLARCAAFIVAPRARTRGVDLAGRSFLHSYDWRRDPGFEVLEQIMTAPLVVASWISLQYYASRVDNATFGAGDKTLHNVTGGLGVLEGAEGDLRSGLALQSLHDGRDWVHEPMRLAAYIEAPVSAINAVLEANPSIRTLVDNGWLHLLALGEEGRVTHRYVGDLRWIPLTSDGTPPPRHAPAAR